MHTEGFRTHDVAGGHVPRDPGVQVPARLVDSCLSTLSVDVDPR